MARTSQVAASVGLLGLLFVLLSASIPVDAALGAIKLRNSTLSINSTSTEVPPEDADAISAAEFSVAANGGLYERADYASAYVNNNTLQLEGGVNPLESFATVEANNSFLWLNNSLFAYEALELLLMENNTLWVEGASLQLNRSTLRLVKNNWLLVTNSSQMSLNTARLNFTDFFTWHVDGSIVSTTNSVLGVTNALTWWQDSLISLENSTFTAASYDPQAPPRYEGKLYPLLVSHGSNIYTNSSKIILQNLPIVHIMSGTLGLTGSDLVINNSTVHFIGQTLDFGNATIYANNSTLLFLGNCTGPAVTSVNVFGGAAALSGNTTALGSELVGQPLGSVDTNLPGVDADIQV